MQSSQHVNSDQRQQAEKQRHQFRLLRAGVRHRRRRRAVAFVLVTEAELAVAGARLLHAHQRHLHLDVQLVAACAHIVYGST